MRQHQSNPLLRTRVYSVEDILSLETMWCPPLSENVLLTKKFMSRNVVILLKMWQRRFWLAFASAKTRKHQVDTYGCTTRYTGDALGAWNHFEWSIIQFNSSDKQELARWYWFDYDYIRTMALGKFAQFLCVLLKQTQKPNGKMRDANT